MRNCIAVFLLLLIPCISKGQTQTYYQYKTDEATLVFFDKNLSRYIPHMIRMYQNGKALHQQIGIALCKGKKEYDKRQTVKEKEDRREMDRAMKGFK